MSRENPRRISNLDFYKAVKLVESDRKTFESCTSAAAAKLITSHLGNGHECSPQTALRAAQAAGVRVRQSNLARDGLSLYSLAAAVAKLFRAMGEPLPSALSHFAGKDDAR